MLIGLVGLPNKGKSTLFNALTLGDAHVANYPFTTIKPNEGIAFASMPCPHAALGLAKCDPKNSDCQNGVRRIPIRIMDVAGLVSGASQGKGMGNQFLSDLSRADALIVVADASGKTDDEGNACENHDPAHEVKILLEELDAWFASVVKNNAHKAKGKSLDAFCDLLSGLNVKKDHVKTALTENNIPENTLDWNELDMAKIARTLRKKTKPIVIAANKIDVADKSDALKELGLPVFKMSAEMALARQKAVKNGFAKEEDGVLVSLKQDTSVKTAIEKINAFGETGVQTMLNHVVFDVLQQIVAYPVEDDTHFSNNFGKVLPDAFLLTKGATALDLAEKVHTDLRTGFLYAIDAKAKRRISKETPLESGAVVKIVSAK